MNKKEIVKNILAIPILIPATLGFILFSGVFMFLAWILEDKK